MPDYASRNRTARTIQNAYNVPVRTKLAAHAVNYVYHTDSKDIERDLNSVATGLENLFSKGWGWAKEKFSEYEAEKERKAAASKREEELRWKRKVLERDLLRGKKALVKQKQDLLKRRRDALLRIKNSQRWYKKKEFWDLGLKLLKCGLRSAATHGVFTVLTHGGGTKIALWLDKHNVVDFVQAGDVSITQSSMQFRSWLTVLRISRSS